MTSSEPFTPERTAHPAAWNLVFHNGYCDWPSKTLVTILSQSPPVGGHTEFSQLLTAVAPASKPSVASGQVREASRTSWPSSAATSHSFGEALSRVAPAPAPRFHHNSECMSHRKDLHRGLKSP